MLQREPILEGAAGWHRALGCLAGFGCELPEAGSEPVLGAASSLKDEEEPSAGLFPPAPHLPNPAASVTWQ